MTLQIVSALCFGAHKVQHDNRLNGVGVLFPVL